MNAATMRPAQIPASVRIYAVGDVHGMADLLAGTFARIDRDLAERPVPVAIEVYLGDLVDRGPDSASVLRMLIARKAEREVVCLAGNHELMMMRALNDLDALEEWLTFGGVATLESFGMMPDAIRVDATTQTAMRRRFQAPIADFLMSLQRSFAIGDYVFVHAGLRPGVPFALQDIDDLTGIRGEFLTSEQHFGFVVVHGHTPCASVEIRSNRINIDTGAYHTGVLTCLAFEADGIRSV